MRKQGRHHSQEINSYTVDAHRKLERLEEEAGPWRKDVQDAQARALLQSADFFSHAMRGTAETQERNASLWN
jgi:hypothetical protein